MRYNIDIQNYLPHREPMLMVDEILEIGQNEAVTSFDIIEGNIFIYDNQFSEAGLIENCAQTCSTITGQNLFEKNDEKPAVIGFISNIKKVKIEALPKVGDQIITKARLISEFQNICNISCETFLDGNKILEAEIVMFIQKIEA